MLITSKPEKHLLNQLDSHLRGNDIKKLCWKDSVAVQKVLDAICQILTEEYCHIAKENPKIFTTGG